MPLAVPGLIGPWADDADAGDLAAWNQRYVEHWSPAEDLRIFWTCTLARF
ncbi:MAG: hypothetical protein R3E12_07700 [Candidatus Eisenbacteria bacterium]